MGELVRSTRVRGGAQVSDLHFEHGQCCSCGDMGPVCGMGHCIVCHEEECLGCTEDAVDLGEEGLPQ
jgi:hypothetical protein